MRLPFVKQRVSDDSIVPAIERFWDSLQGTSGFTPRLQHRVWAAARCLQLNSQQIASMPLRFIGSSQPAWVTNPDPVWFPNGIGDAIFAAVWSMYAGGDAFLLVTARYANTLPSAWTVLDPGQMNIRVINGQRSYEYRSIPLNADDVVQISRNPHGQIRGSSALRAYAAHLWGSIAASELGRDMIGGAGGVPTAVLKSQRKLTKDQAEALQEQWMTRMVARRGPAVLPPEIDFQELSFSPRDLLLLDAQEFNAKVIASAFGVPAFMLNMPLEGGLVYQNPEILFDYWWRAELRPAAGRISDALTAQMLPRGSSVHFDATDSLQPGLKDLHSIWLEALAAGAVTQDEYRRAVLQIGPLGEQNALDEILQPNVADASPADQPTSEVIALRPTQAVT